MTAKKDKPQKITPEIIERARRALWAAVLSTKLKKPKRKGDRRVH